MATAISGDDHLMKPEHEGPSPPAANDELMKPDLSSRDASATATKPSPKADKLVDGMPAEYFVLESGDHELLAKLVRRYPGLEQTILEHAARDLGNETVAKACEILHGAKPEPKKADEAKPAAKQKPDDVLMLVYILEPGDQEHLATLIRSHPDMQEQIVAEAKKWVGEETVKKALELLGGHEGDGATEHEAGGDAAPGEAPKAAGDRKNEPGWVTRARAFNKRNGDFALMFNYATKWSMTGGGSEPDPYLVAQWQERHGLSPDGRVGEKTAQRAVDASQPEVAKDRERESILADLE